MPGCPVCRLVHKQTDRYLDSILYEAVLDPDVRAKLKASHGFCRDHVEMLRSKPGRALGIALIYRDIIRSICETVGKAEQGGRGSLLRQILGRSGEPPAAVGRLSADQVCPACEIGAQAESRIIDLLAAYLDEEELYQAYAQGEGLCLAHLVQALEIVDGAAALENLVRPQVDRYRRMLGDLDEFIRKRDHRFKGEKYGEEGDVWLRAMNAVIGGAGMGLSAKSGGRPSDDIPRREAERQTHGS
jgi:hypothetical protein